MLHAVRTRTNLVLLAALVLAVTLVILLITVGTRVIGAPVTVTTSSVGSTR